MSILLTPIRNPLPAFLYNRVCLSSLVSPPKDFLLPRRADSHSVSASRRSWWDLDEDNVRKGRRSRRWLLNDEEDQDGGKGSWWSRSADGYDDYYDDGDDSTFFEDEPDVGQTEVWFFKVLKSYGWMVPAIILSMLLASGPKAFFMALALPLGQSALSFAVDKLWGRTKAAPKPPKSNSRKSKFTNPSAASDRKPSTPSDASEVHSSGSNSWATYGKASDLGPRFGGWDELDINEPRKQPLGRRPKAKSSSASTSKGGSQNKSKLVRRGRNGDTPLLLRLLIAVFPFLGSWVKIL